MRTHMNIHTCTRAHTSEPWGVFWSHLVTNVSNLSRNFYVYWGFKRTLMAQRGWWTHFHLTVEKPSLKSPAHRCIKCLRTPLRVSVQSLAAAHQAPIVPRSSLWSPVAPQRETEMKAPDSFCPNQSGDITNMNTCPTHAITTLHRVLGYALCSIIAGQINPGSVECSSQGILHS